MKLLALFFALVFVCTGADVAGKWNLVVPNRDGAEVKFTLNIQQSGEKYSGSIVNENGEAIPLTDVQVAGAEVKFKVVSDEATYDVTATVDGPKMKGAFKVNDQPGGSFTGTKAGS